MNRKLNFDRNPNRTNTQLGDRDIISPSTRKDRFSHALSSSLKPLRLKRYRIRAFSFVQITRWLLFQLLVDADAHRSIGPLDFPK